MIRSRAGRIACGILAVVLGAAAVAGLVLVLVVMFEAATAPVHPPPSDAIGRACLNGNESACQAYPVAKQIDPNDDPMPGAVSLAMSLVFIAGVLAVGAVMCVEAATGWILGKGRITPRRPDEDEGSAQTIGAILCLGVVVLIFASCVWVFAWCPSCQFSAEGQSSGAWASLGAAHVEHGADGETLSCRPIVYMHNGYATTTGAEKCGLVDAKVNVESYSAEASG